MTLIAEASNPLAQDEASTGRRTVLAGLLAVPAVARAQSAYPNRPIRYVVPWAPGGATSNIARIIGDAMAPILGQPVVQDNRPGAGGGLGSDFVAKAAPDGYTLLAAGAGTFYRSVVERDVPYDAFRDFGFVAPVGDGPFVLITRQGLADDLASFIAKAKSEPGKMNYASSGIGSTSHLTTEMFNHAAGIEATHIPYRGAQPAMIDLISGRVDYCFDALTSVAEHVRAGRIAALAATTTQRSAFAPEIPTIAETVLPGFSAAPWWGIVTPAGLPPEVTAKLSAAVIQAQQDPTVVARLADQGCRAFSMPPGEFAEFVRRENSRWVNAIEVAGLRVS
ncbi:tripartite tricarboxylate transporter substrate binding protein [Roseomonas sp. CAU 1739]|uniref:Bug family tripartite tricarboxylate transporter substrate binding protein n=1 Tax=Roseomonas sp. CAU 1739 TaxID=3140364 RepID=UPI00325C1D13